MDDGGDDGGRARFDADGPAPAPTLAITPEAGPRAVIAPVVPAAPASPIRGQFLPASRPAPIPTMTKIAVPCGLALGFGAGVFGAPLVAVGVVVAWLVGGTGVGIVWFKRQFARFQPDVIAAVAALGRGQPARAEALMTPWARRTPATVRLSSRHILAWVHIMQDQPRDGIELFAANELEARALTRSGLGATTAFDLALCHALIDGLDAAACWLELGAQRRRTTTTHDAAQALAQAVLDCRRGRHAEAARSLDDHWPDYDAVAAAPLLRQLSVLRGFARAGAGPREAGPAAAVIARPTYPGEYQWLAVEWPEMAAFLIAHGLGGRPEPSAGEGAARPTGA